MEDNPDKLREVVEAQHGGSATAITSVSVTDRFDGQIAWEGVVYVFALEGQPQGATRAYAWSYEKDDGGRRYVAVLHTGPIKSPADAVRAAIVAERRS